jgi:hypothetical protein
VIELAKFSLAGNATFTATSVKTGTRFTFRVRQPSPESPHFVSLLNGSDNEGSYCFMGTIFNGQDFRMGRKSRITAEAPSAKAFTWIWAHRNDPSLSEKVTIHHEGKCCRCGRKLTVPGSIESGLGPECAGKVSW